MHAKGGVAFGHRIVGLVAALGLVAAACGDDGGIAAPAPTEQPPPPDETGPPVGEALLPDLVPLPEVDVTTFEEPRGHFWLRFSSTLVNVGEGDFLLRATRADGGDGTVPDGWRVVQNIQHSTSGVEPAPVDASLVWGGDGHGHWHVARIVTYRLVPLDESGDIDVSSSLGTDGKVGFCFFDFEPVLRRAPAEPVHVKTTCGEEETIQVVRMGLTPGWGDTYPYDLPGQRIDIEGVPDGSYRLLADADEHGWFREATRENNRTWVDLELGTLPDGLRTALVVGIGPRPDGMNPVPEFTIFT